jgi:glutamate-ammonia-ligase adenylyltransferase
VAANPRCVPGPRAKHSACSGQWRVIEPEVEQRLDSAYVLLRTIEHRLQMVDDRQTHEIPASADAADNVARLHGLDAGGDLLDLLRPHVEWVGANYDKLNPFQAEERLSRDDRKLADQIMELGFPDITPVTERLTRWRAGSVRALRSATALEALEKLLPICCVVSPRRQTRCWRSPASSS